MEERIMTTTLTKDETLIAPANTHYSSYEPTGFLTHSSAWCDLGHIFNNDIKKAHAPIGIVRKSGAGQYELCLWATPQNLRLHLVLQQPVDTMDARLNSHNNNSPRSAANLQTAKTPDPVTAPESLSRPHMSGIECGQVRFSGARGVVTLLHLPTVDCRILT
jgi:hypothetical protein